MPSMHSYPSVSRAAVSLTRSRLDVVPMQPLQELPSLNRSGSLGATRSSSRPEPQGKGNCLTGPGGFGDVPHRSAVLAPQLARPSGFSRDTNPVLHFGHRVALIASAVSSLHLPVGPRHRMGSTRTSSKSDGYYTHAVNVQRWEGVTWVSVGEGTAGL